MSQPSKTPFLPPSKVTWKQLGIAYAIMSVLLAITIYAARQPIPCVKPEEEVSMRATPPVAAFVHGGVPQRPICKGAAEPRNAEK